MKRREFIAFFTGTAAAWATAAGAQQPGRLRRIGVLESGGGTPVSKARAEVLRATLAKLGWHEGKNIRFEWKESFADIRRARANGDDLVALAPDVIVATNTQMVQVLQEKTRTIPIVFINVPDSVVGALVGSVARPTRNATGFINLTR